MASRQAVPHLSSNKNEPTAKWAPRQADGAADPSPVRGNVTPRGGSGATPTNRQQVTSTPRSRFSSSNHSPSQAYTPNGSTLYVSGMASTQRKRASEAGSHMFRSSTSIGDAHIKDCSLRVTSGPYSAAKSTFQGAGTAAFRSRSPSDRDSHMRSLMASTYASPRSPGSRSPGRQPQLPSASFRSVSPTACAHITALPKPTDASYNYGGPRDNRIGSASFRSTTSIADAHIKASPRMHDSTAVVTPRGSARECTSPFRSTTSIADAHIKALTKPVDVVVAYRD